MESGTRVVGPAAPDLVWEAYAVPQRWPQWAPQITAVQIAGAQVGAPRIAAGMTGRVFGPCGLPVRFTVTEVDEQRRMWAWRVRLGPVRLELRHGVERHPRGCATWLRVTGPAPVVAAYLPIARVALRRLVHLR